MDFVKHAQRFLAEIAILPRRLLLETPDVQATVPLLRGVWGAALHDLDPRVFATVFETPDSAAFPPTYVLRPAPPDPKLAPAIDFTLFAAAIEHDAVLMRAWDIDVLP